MTKKVGGKLAGRPRWRDGEQDKVLLAAGPLHPARAGCGSAVPCGGHLLLCFSVFCLPDMPEERPR